MLIRKDCQAIVRAVVGLARSLEIKTIAEGIETKDQLEAARSDGCDEGQGFLFGKAMPSDAVLPFLSQLKLVASAA